MIYLYNSDPSVLNHSAASANFLNASNATTTTMVSGSNIQMQNLSHNTHNIAANASSAIQPTSLAVFKNKTIVAKTDKAKNAIYLANAASFFTNITSSFAALSTGNIQQDLEFIQIPYK